jgi:HlyD family secretion protein
VQISGFFNQVKLVSERQEQYMKNRIILIAVIGAVIILISTTIVSRFLSGQKQTAEISVPVAVAKPHIGAISRTLEYTGTLAPANMVSITSKIAGKIEKIFVKKGDFVTKNQVLVKIEDNTVNLQRDQADSYLKAAEAQFEKAKKGVREEEIANVRALVEKAAEDMKLAEENFARTKTLYESGTISKAKYDEAESMLRAAKTNLDNAKRTLKLMEEGASEEEIEMARANMEAARAMYELAKLQVSFTEVGTPAYGLIADILVDEGNMVGTSTPIMVIVHINPIIAKIPVPEKYYSEFNEKRLSIRILVFPDALPGTGGFEGVISNIAPTIDPLSRTFLVEIEIPNSGCRLRPGMYVNVRIDLDQRTDVMLLPLSARAVRNNRDVVFLISENSSPVAEQKEIVSGLVGRDVFEIVSGLSLNDRVIVEGNLFLENGQKVRVVK